MCITLVVLDGESVMVLLTYCIPPLDWWYCIDADFPKKSIRMQMQLPKTWYHAYGSGSYDSNSYAKLLNRQTLKRTSRF
jgi:hypothetical protein